jgi:hypothetical protein
MRTTLDLDDSLLERARQRARELRVTLTLFVENALAAALAGRARRSERFRLRWKPHQGRFIGGFDIADRDALYDAMEKRR